MLQLTQHPMFNGKFFQLDIPSPPESGLLSMREILWRLRIPSLVKEEYMWMLQLSQHPKLNGNNTLFPTWYPASFWIWLSEYERFCGGWEYPLLWVFDSFSFLCCLLFFSNMLFFCFYLSLLLMCKIFRFGFSSAGDDFSSEPQPFFYFFIFKFYIKILLRDL